MAHSLPSDSTGPSRPGDAPVNAMAEYDYSNFYYSASDDLFTIFGAYDDWWHGYAREHGYYLFYQAMHGAPTPRIELEEGLHHEKRSLLNLASYNYLGLSYHPEVIAAGKAALDKYGLGAAGSPTLSGSMDVHHELEKALAAHMGKEAAMIFPTGYSTNVGLLAGLVRPGDWIIMDQNAHASIVDGAILSKANTRFFRHNRPDELDRKLKEAKGKKLVIVEGVYSMDGDIAALPEMVAVARKHGARIMIDEAHSGFVYGPNGRGVAEHFGLDHEMDIHVGTFSKALGGMGGYVAGSKSLINYLMGFARSRVFSCALSPVVTAGVLQALHIAEREPALRTRLWDNVAHLRKRLGDAGVDMGDSTSQVIPVMIRKDPRIFAIGEKLLDGGIYLQPIIYPAVAKHKSRFRISVSAAHTPELLDKAADILIDVLSSEQIL